MIVTQSFCNSNSTSTLYLEVFHTNDQTLPANNLNIEVFTRVLKNTQVTPVAFEAHLDVESFEAGFLDAN